ncbi:MAG: hypothetical protein ABSF03_33670 [Streptosporangiaceae bacterium]
MPVTSTGCGDGGGRPVGRGRPDVTFADRTAVSRLGCRQEERRGVVVKARATRPLSPVPTTRRARGADERTVTAVTYGLVTPVAALPSSF